MQSLPNEDVLELSHQGDQAEMEVLASEAPDTVVLVNAFGAAQSLLQPLAALLREEFSVLIPGPWSRRATAGAGYSPQEQALDLARRVRGFRRGRLWLVGYCSGADIALRALLGDASMFSGAVLVSGSFGLGPGAPAARDAKLMCPLLEIAARGVDEAGTIRDGLDQANRHFSSRQLSPLAAKLRRSASIYLEDAQSLHTYAKMVLDLLGRDVRDVAVPASNVKLTLLTAKSDTVAHWEQSRWVAEHVPSSRLIIMDDWDHYAIGYMPDAQLRVRQELRELARVEGSSQTASVYERRCRHAE